VLEVLPESYFIYIPESKLVQISPTADALKRATKWLYCATATGTEN